MSGTPDGVLPPLVPRPRRWAGAEGVLRLDAASTIGAPDELQRVASWFRSELGVASGLGLHPAPLAEATIRLGLDPALPAEGFVLEITTTHLALRGGDPAGVFYGLQAVRQLLPQAAFARAQVGDGPWDLPCGVVEDAPRFAWRGVLLDVARHFLPLDDLLRFVDLLAMHRINTLHLHLTDDQGWRLEIAGYPRLTEVGGWRRESQVGAGEDAPGDGRPHGGWYTRADIAQLVSYAADRFVTVVPEIELPGHVQALVAAYPALGAGLDDGPDGWPLAPEVWTRWGISDHVLSVDDATVAVLCDVLDEVVAMFPSPVVCLGGDESPKRRWRDDARVAARRAELGGATDPELHNWLVARLAEHLDRRGRRAMVWDEVLEGPDVPGVVVASWRGEHGVRVGTRRGYDVVSSPADRVYLDYRQSDDPDEPIPTGTVTTLLDVYGFDPAAASGTAVPGAGTTGVLLGAQANLWTEHIDSRQGLEYMAFPRVAALAEALWSTGEKDGKEFLDRLVVHLGRLDTRGVAYRRPGGPAPWQKRPGVVGDLRTPHELEAHIAHMVAAFAQEP